MPGCTGYKQSQLEFTGRHRQHMPPLASGSLIEQFSSVRVLSQRLIDDIPGGHTAFTALRCCSQAHIDFTQRRRPFANRLANLTISDPLA